MSKQDQSKKKRQRESQEEKIKTILEKGTKEIIKKSSLTKKLKSGKKLRVKYGIDPTGSQLHLGHLVNIRKLKQFQKAGHQVVFLIGDFTARIGDPSGRSKTRPPLSEEEIKKNEKDYLKQIEDIIDLDQVEVRHNSEWFSKMNFGEVLELASHFSLSRVIERNDFQNRINKGRDVRYHEGLYPLMQAYDSVVLEADVEIGGTDQRFNLLAGRTLQKQYNQKQQDILMMPILTGTDGTQKMSKSYDNYIALREDPSEQYGKTMSIPDILMVEYFHLVTDLPSFEIKGIENQLELKKNPKDVKKKLAYTIVSELHSEKAAEEAQKEFERVFEENKEPDEMEVVELEEDKEKRVADLIVEMKMASSKSEAKRLIEQGGVRVDGATIGEPQASIALKDGMVVNVGKTKFKKISLR